jgi:hypothetical protein
MIGIIIVYVAILVLMIASQWKIFTKAGKPGWACIVPIYNIVVLLEIVKKPTWWVILFLIPIVNFVILILIMIELAKAFGKDGGFAAGLILLGVVFLPILAFGDAKYIYGEKGGVEDHLVG